MLMSEQTKQDIQDQSEREMMLECLIRIEGFLYCSILNDDYSSAGSAYDDVKNIIKTINSTNK